jgi:hypothetical protein
MTAIPTVVIIIPFIDIHVAYRRSNCPNNPKLGSGHLRLYEENGEFDEISDRSTRVSKVFLAICCGPPIAVAASVH